jgi:hypothetical protein
LKEPRAWLHVDRAAAGSAGIDLLAAVPNHRRRRDPRLVLRFAAQVDAAAQAGEARPVDAKRLTRYLWGAWNGVISLRLQPDGLRLSDEEIVETLELARSCEKDWPPPRSAVRTAPSMSAYPCPTSPDGQHYSRRSP